MGVRPDWKGCHMKKVKNQIIFLLSFIVLWQVIYMTGKFPALMFPSVADIGKALINCFTKDGMMQTIGYSLQLVLKGMLIGSIGGMVLSCIAIAFHGFRSVCNMIVSIFDPLPGIALLPLAILWFGTGEKSIIFIIVHSVIWPVIRNMLDSYGTIPQIYVEAGQNIGLNSIQIIRKVYLPASFPYLLSGMRISWARAWRALISAEMIFGVSGSAGGLGWFIYIKRYQLETASVFAALVIIIIIGLLIEYGFFAVIEKHTVRKWGMIK